MRDRVEATGKLLAVLGILIRRSEVTVGVILTTEHQTYSESQNPISHIDITIVKLRVQQPPDA